VSIEEPEKVARLVGRELVESIGLDGVSMAGIWPDSASSGARRELKLLTAFPPTAGKGYMSGVGSAGKTADSHFRLRNLWLPIKLFMVSGLLRALIGAVCLLATLNWRLFYGFGPFTGTARDALTDMENEIPLYLLVYVLFFKYLYKPVNCCSFVLM
jgi:hypothetical protein